MYLTCLDFHLTSNVNNHPIYACISKTSNDCLDYRLRKKERQRQNKKSKTQPNDQDDIETTTAKDSEDEHEDEEGGIHESPFVIGGK